MISRQHGCRLVLGPVLVLLAVTLAGVVVTAPAAEATPAVTPCSVPNIAVVVQFPDGGGTRSGCVDSAANPSGWTVLVNAGFSVHGTAQYPDSFVCQIDSVPTSQCATTPPPKASWSYWHANPGATSWTYTPLGAASFHPGAGSVDAWTFGGGQPTVSPSAVLPVASAPPPAPPSTTPNGTTGPPLTTGKSEPPPETASAPGEVATSAQAPTVPPATSTSVDPSTTPAALSRKNSANPGSAVPTIVGGGLVALLAGGGFVTARRRRPTGPSGSR